MELEELVVGGAVVVERGGLVVELVADWDVVVVVLAVVLGGAGAIAVTLIWAYIFPELRRAKTFDLPKEMLT